MIGRLRMSPNDARTLRRGAIAILAIVAVGKGIPALRRVEANVRTAATESARELSSLRAAARGQKTMRDSLLVRRRRLEIVRAGLIEASSPQLAAAELAATLGEYATTAGARVNATVVRSDSAFARGLAHVFVRLSIATDIQGIAELLERIETDPRLLAVRELTLGGSDPGAHETRAEVLASELVVEGLAYHRLLDVPRRERAAK
jgi:hypothetical protein